MEYILDDFVNRDKLLDLMWQIAQQKIKPRILVIESGFGMGKTYLLKEFKAECQEEGIEIARVDFVEKDWDPGYMYVVREIFSQLGARSFEPLAETMHETIQRSAQARMQTNVKAIQANREVNRPPPAPTTFEPASSAIEDSPPSASDISGSRSGGVDIHDGKHIFRDVAGRDIIHLTQIIQREDPFVQEWASAQIAEALKGCLVEITSQRRIVFLFDHWQKADQDTRRWLARSLIKWTADLLLPKASIILAGEEPIDLDPRRRIKRKTLPELDEEFVRIYLVKKHGLLPEEFEVIFQANGGVPLMLTMAVARRARPLPKR